VAQGPVTYSTNHVKRHQNSRRAVAGPFRSVHRKRDTKVAVVLFLAFRSQGPGVPIVDGSRLLGGDCVDRTTSLARGPTGAPEALEPATSKSQRAKPNSAIGLPPQSGHVSNFCRPIGTVIEPGDTQCFQNDRCGRPTTVHAGPPAWTRLELTKSDGGTSFQQNQRPSQCGGAPARNMSYWT
jgi:hypothetical protein